MFDKKSGRVLAPPPPLPAPLFVPYSLSIDICLKSCGIATKKCTSTVRSDCKLPVQGRLSPICYTNNSTKSKRIFACV